MQITKEFLESEIADLETESQKARNFLIQSQATIQAYKMLINRLDAPEPEQPDGTDTP
jgi:septal ring factor EnvC (AmiA/AmiB activator)